MSAISLAGSLAPPGAEGGLDLREKFPSAGAQTYLGARSTTLLIFGRRHLEYVLREFVEHYQEARPHQGLGQRTPRRRTPIQASETGPVLRRDRLGGVLHEYFSEAA